MWTQPVRIADHVLFRTVEGAGGILLDLDQRRYFAFDEVAALMWRALSETGDPVDAVEAVARVYEADRMVLERDVEEFVRGLGERNWVHPSVG